MIENRTPVSSKVAMVLETGEARFDLTGRPTRDEAGMLPGREYVDYERDGPLHVTVALPEDRQLDLMPRRIAFDSYGARDGTAAPPSTMDIHYYAAGPKDGLDRLLADAQTLRLNMQPFLVWYDEATGPPPAIDSTVKSLWVTSHVGYLRVEIQARYDRSYAPGYPDQTVIQYTFSWYAGPD